MKTAMQEIIDYLQEMLDDDFDSRTKYIQEFCEQALESEKQQIIKAYDDAFKYVVGGGFVAKTGEQYFEEIYNDKN